MKKKKGLLWGLGIAAGAAAVGYFLKNNKANSVSADADSEEEVFFSFSDNAKIGYKEAKEKALGYAREKLGKGAGVASASDHKTITVSLSGENRYCYLFGAVADDLSVNPETLLVYVDAENGQVFESSEIKS